VFIVLRTISGARNDKQANQQQPQQMGVLFIITQHMQPFFIITFM
jgi:hypothetical protein